MELWRSTSALALIDSAIADLDADLAPEAESANVARLRAILKLGLSSEARAAVEATLADRVAQVAARREAAAKVAAARVAVYEARRAVAALKGGAEPRSVSPGVAAELEASAVRLRAAVALFRPRPEQSATRDPRPGGPSSGPRV